MSPKTLISALRKCDWRIGEYDGSDGYRFETTNNRDLRLSFKIEKRLLQEIEIRDGAILDLELEIKDWQEKWRPYEA